MTETLKHRMQLADFLKTRRARLRPEQFDLPAYPKRRAPGLRREEVAQLVGVGISWYTWLEQGRDIHASDQVLFRLAHILQLDEQERRHMFVLARGLVPLPNMLGDESPLPDAAHQAILNGLGHNPALLVDRRLNVVAWNESAAQVFGDFTNRSERERNVVWSAFMNLAHRKRLVNWEVAARRSIAFLHARSDQYANEGWFTELVADLQQASPEFRAWWPEHDILLTCNGPNEIDHPLVGYLSLQGTTLVVPEQPDLQMVVHTPLLADTATKLGELMAGGSRLTK